MRDLNDLKLKYTPQQRKEYLEHFKYNRNTQEHIEWLEKAVIEFNDEMEIYENAFFIAMFLFEKVIKELKVDLLPLFNDNQEKLFKQLYAYYRENDYMIFNIESLGIAKITSEEKDKGVVV